MSSLFPTLLGRSCSALLSTPLFLLLGLTEEISLHVDSLAAKLFLQVLLSDCFDLNCLYTLHLEFA